MDILKQIHGATVKATQEAYQKISKKIEEDYQKEFYNIMESYYADYPKPPRKYNHYGGLGFGMAPVFVSMSGLKCSIVMRTDPSYIDDVTHDPIDYVFYRSYEHGIHGTADIFVTSPSPQETMKKFDSAYKGAFMSYFSSEMSKALSKILK